MKNKYAHYAAKDLIILQIEQLIKTYFSFFWKRKTGANYQAIYSSEPKKSNLCLFSAFSHGNIAEYVYYYLSEIMKLEMDVVYISASKISDIDRNKLIKIGIIQIIEKENIMPDFSAWKIGLELNDYGMNCDSVLLANDSVFGPLFNLKDCVNEMQARKSDFWGMTDSFSLKYHLQSYFLLFNQSVISSKSWVDFWKKLKTYTDKKVVIYRYETQFTDYLLKRGFTSDSFIKYTDFEEEILRVDKKYKNCNYLIYMWKELIEEKKFPFLKRSIVEYEKIRTMLFHEINHDWKSALMNSTSYPIDYILKYLKNVDKDRR